MPESNTTVITRRTMPESNTTVITRRTITFTLEDIEEIILKSTGLIDGEIAWEDYSGGGVRGCVVTQETTRTEPE